MSTPTYTTTDPTVCVDILMDETGYGSIAPITVIEVFQETVRKHGDRFAMATKQGMNVSVVKYDGVNFWIPGKERKNSFVIIIHISLPVYVFFFTSSTGYKASRVEAMDLAGILG